MKINYVGNAILIVSLVLKSCNMSSNKEHTKLNNTSNYEYRKIYINHAIGFGVDYIDGYKIVRLTRPWQGSSQPITYILRENSTPQNDSISELGEEIIIPLQSIVCNSTSHLSLLESLGLESKIKGFAQTSYIYSEKINELVRLDNIVEVGIDAQINVEKILDMNPDAVMAFNAGQENKQLNNLENLGLNIVMNADYMETTLLGRAEWIKFVALFFNKEHEANQVFDKLEKRYDSLINIAQNNERPTVLSGTVYGSTWFMPAGKNYNAQLVQNSGGDYIWRSNTESGWLNLDFEVVFEKASEADFWIGVADFKSLDQMKDADARYADFKAFKNKKVYTYTARVNENGANDYFESGNVNPDLILADHIKILHPELLPDYKLYYYKQLK